MMFGGWDEANGELGPLLLVQVGGSGNGKRAVGGLRVGKKGTNWAV